MKIIDKIKTCQESGEKFFSLEFFPPKTETGLQNLYNRLDRMASLEPAFIDVTWGAGGSTKSVSLDMSTTVQKYFGVDVMMHLTCSQMSKDNLHKIMSQCLSAGLQNILALRGDPPLENQADTLLGPSEFSFAEDLISFIREYYGNQFGIAVGGYPEGHPEAKSKDECIEFLRRKVERGADFIITQLFYDLREYEEFLERCARAKINCPIIPGVMPIQNFERFQKFADFCQLKIPTSVREALEPIKTDDESVRSYGIDLCLDMCQKLQTLGAPGFHFYTLNLESSVTSILQGLGLTANCRTRRALPWRPSTTDQRRGEDVRPIFWSNRPKSYIARTLAWDDFPNGRWGNSFSPTYGELTDYYMFRRVVDDKNRQERLKMWGSPITEQELADVFAGYCSGKVERLPWCDMPVHQETGRIITNIMNLNRQKYLTINSQPQVNGASSNDPDVGWGGGGGRVFQKAYIEFFAPRSHLEKLIEKAKDFPSITYHAVNSQGESFSNLPGRSVNAVTWGIFPGKEILQPTVVDSDSFMIWKDEAFGLWLDDWRSIYRKDSASYELISKIHREYFLVNVVENDFVDGDIFRLFDL